MDIEHGFTPICSTSKARGRSDPPSLVKEAKKSDKVYLATDPDREGEAISWHLAHLLDLDLKDENRVTFNEITKTGVQNGMAHPGRSIRRWWTPNRPDASWTGLWVIKSAPLWRKIRRGLSAGRVQSVAVKLIVDREEEIRAFKSEEYWTIDASLLAEGSRKAFPAKYHGHGGKNRRSRTRETADAILAAPPRGGVPGGHGEEGVRKKSPCSAVYHLHPPAGGFPANWASRRGGP